MKTTKSIAFGFYNGLGDIISDKPIIDHFLKEGFFVEVFVYAWLEEFTNYLFPKAKVKAVQDTKSIQTISIDSEKFFLTPNYLHKFSYSKTSVLSYIIKKRIVKSKVKELIAVDLLTLFLFAFDIKKTFIDAHFFDRSYNLLKKRFDSIDFYLEENSIKNKVEKLYLFPFSGRDEKDYPQEKFLSILKNLDKKKITIFVQPKDKKRLKKEFYNYQIKSLSLDKITDMMDENCLVLANDSGPAHLGAMKNSAVIALYGLTDPKIYKPRGKGEIVYLRVKNQNVADIDEKMILSVISKLNFT